MLIMSPTKMSYLCLEGWVAKVHDCCVHLHPITLLAHEILQVFTCVIGLFPRVGVRGHQDFANEGRPVVSHFAICVGVVTIKK